uniref:Uncharacterized protein n=1 Tax=Chromera velia CCMP2878 TaxID=1169474 RepID=A0A0G4HHD2_9ALVE|eukprot:Cvel_6870.t1-p1 / transcript=Cvel_6870.t1 / gene=Cvel_6870 / organism=Chromera_velia_CCMP2878 / gene_product=hypothetical protein / transcript_product=hypothetical protein / location=Cvel_scaffold347:32374-36647(-) / protein_length=392 / sequence_SO=supercontig / SO=protein_coding / is_pseudo=false
MACAKRERAYPEVVLLDDLDPSPDISMPGTDDVTAAIDEWEDESEDEGEEGSMWEEDPLIQKKSILRKCMLHGLFQPVEITGGVLDNMKEQAMTYRAWFCGHRGMHCAQAVFDDVLCDLRTRFRDAYGHVSRCKSNRSGQLFGSLEQFEECHKECKRKAVKSYLSTLDKEVRGLVLAEMGPQLSDIGIEVNAATGSLKLKAASVNSLPRRRQKRGAAMKRVQQNMVRAPLTGLGFGAVAGGYGLAAAARGVEVVPVVGKHLSGALQLGGLAVGGVVGGVVSGVVGIAGGVAGAAGAAAGAVADGIADTAELGGEARCEASENQPAAQGVDGERRAEVVEQEGYQFGDWTRGVIVKGREEKGGNANDEYQFGDFSRGMVPVGSLFGGRRSSRN